VARQDDEEYMTPEEASTRLGISRRTLDRYAAAGRLKRYTRGLRNVYYRRSEVEYFAQELSEIRPKDDESSR